MALLAMKTLLIPKDVLCWGLAKCRRLRLAGLVTLLYLLLVVPAWAAPQRSALVLSITEEGKQQDSLRTQVEELVQRAGARVIVEGSLSSSARACGEPTCLGKLASEHRVELILAARISRHSRHERMVDMWIYDAKSGKDKTGNELCDVRDMKDCVTGLAGKLIGPQLVEPHEGSATSTAASGISTPKAAVVLNNLAPSDRRQRESSGSLPAWRKGLGLGLGLLAAGALVTAVGAHIKNGRDGESTTCMAVPDASCRYELTSVFVPSYVAAGVLGIGTVLSLTLPNSRTARKENSR